MNTKLAPARMKCPLCEKVMAKPKSTRWDMIAHCPIVRRTAVGAIGPYYSAIDGHRLGMSDRNPNPPATRIYHRLWAVGALLYQRLVTSPRALWAVLRFIVTGV